MSEDWSAIASEVSEALGEVGMICTLRRAAQPQTGQPQTNPYEDAPNVAQPVDTAVTAVQSMVRVRDASGTFIGQTMRKLTMAADGIEPLKSDTLAVNVHPDDVTDATIFHDITDIEPLAPAGVVVKYGLLIAD